MTRLAGRLRQGHCLTYPRPAAADRDRPTSCLDADARRLRPGLLLLWSLTFRAPPEAAEAADRTSRTPHKDAGSFTRGADAISANTDGYATPMRGTVRDSGVWVIAPGV